MAENTAPTTSTPTPEPAASQPAPKKSKNSLAKILMIVATVLILIGAAFALVSLLNKSDDEPQAPAAVVQVAQVKITAKGFEPANLIVKTGTTVEWTSEGKISHVIASNPHPSHSDLSDLVSPQLGSGATYRYTFTKAGTYNYHDDLKPTTNGTITVQ